MNNFQPDEQFMLEVSRGNLDAPDPLFEKYHVKRYNYFLHRYHSKEMSEDLTQNVFQRIIKYKKSFRTRSTFRPWIYKIAQNMLYAILGSWFSLMSSLNRRTW